MFDYLKVSKPTCIIKRQSFLVKVTRYSEVRSLEMSISNIITKCVSGVCTLFKIFISFISYIFDITCSSHFLFIAMLCNMYSTRSDTLQRFCKLFRARSVFMSEEFQNDASIFRKIAQITRAFRLPVLCDFLSVGFREKIVYYSFLVILRNHPFFKLILAVVLVFFFSF